MFDKELRVLCLRDFYTLASWIDIETSILSEPHQSLITNYVLSLRVFYPL